MSYARMSSDSDVYVYRTGDDDHICCHWCSLTDHGRWDGKRAEAVAHLEAHAAAGHKVPEHALERLREEIAAGQE